MMTLVSGHWPTLVLCVIVTMCHCYYVSLFHLEQLICSVSSDRYILKMSITPYTVS
jgi:hypothetical protein